METKTCQECGRPYQGRGRWFCSRSCSTAAKNHQRVKERPRCLNCGQPVKRMRAKTCSFLCAGEWASKIGSHRHPFPPERKAANWKGGKVMDVSGYVRIYSRTARRYLLEHRVVMEAMLGRPLVRTEFVHHRNGIKTDNRPENLELMTRNPHRGTVTCPHCGERFAIR